MKRSSLVLIPLSLALLAARKPGDPKYENHFAPGPPPASDAVSFEVKDAESQDQFIQVDLRATNRTKDQLIVYKKGEAKFVTSKGTFTTAAGSIFGGPVLLEPGDARSVGFKVEGQGFTGEPFTLQPVGLYIGPNAGVPIKTPEFTLPATNNTFSNGPFYCKMVSVAQATQKTAAVFACTYSGDGIGYIDAAKIGVREPKGQEFANVARNAPRDTVLPGATARFTVWFEIPAKVADMQFATLSVLFRDAFSESPLKPMGLADWAFNPDAAATAAANR